MSRAALRSVAGRLPPRTRGLLARAVTARRDSVSVVVAVSDDNSSFLRECLASLGSQQRRADEVLLVVTGVGADTLAAVDAEVRGSWRVRQLPTPGGSTAAALNRGAAAASGDLLVLVEAGDVLTPAALLELTHAIAAAGSDVAVGGCEATGTQTPASAPWAFLGRDLGTVLLRRSFWQASGLHALEGPVGDWLPTTRALLAAGTFATVRDPVRRWGRRGTGAGFTAMPRTAPWVPEWVDAVDEVLTALSERDLGARETFLGWVLEADAPRFLDDAESCTPQQWHLLAGLLGRLLEATTPTGLLDVPVERRVQAWLAAHGRRVDLEQLNAARWLEDQQRPTRLVGERVLAVLPVADVPEPVLELAPRETRLVARLHGARWAGATEIELDVLAAVREVGREHGPAALRLALVEDDGRTLELEPVPLEDPHLGVLLGERFHDQTDALYRARVDAAVLVGHGAGRWVIHCAWQRGAVRRSAVVAETERRGSAAAFPGRLVGGQVVTIDPDGPAILSGQGDAGPAPAAPTSVTALSLDGGDLLVRGRTTEAQLRLKVHGQRGTVTAATDLTPTAGVTDASFETRLPLRHDPWATGAHPLPAGVYRLDLVAGGATVPLAMAPELAAATPYTVTSSVFRLRVERTPDGAARLVLGAPLRDDESGPHAQERLRRWYATDEHRLDPRTVYLQSYTGQSATDSPLAVHHALRRLRPDLRPVWAVADRATAVPDGAEPVLIGSREWYGTLATSGHLVTNIDMEGWFRKRPGQRLLQTYHGYPSKAMGIAAWRGKNLTPLRIERQLRRTSGTWDLLLTPVPAMDVHYREQYRYDGPIHSRGYPRDDALVGPEAGKLRARARAALGLGDRTAVLYAPTWRDDLATNFRSAAMPSIFDVERAAEALGEEFVLLLRGHRFHQRRAARSPRLVDVTDHPEINDLVLACDAAVLDYSSLRFELALLGRPMVFLVPDLARYEGGVRGFLFDFRSSAPGRLVSTTGEVIEALSHLARWEHEHQDRCRAFNREFNPYQDGHAAERVVEAFFGLRPDAPS